MHHQGSPSRRVLGVGGGIAGFAMMRALGQRGIPAMLVDRLNGPPDAGLGLNLPGNAPAYGPPLSEPGADGRQCCRLPVGGS